MAALAGPAPLSTLAPPLPLRAIELNPSRVTSATSRQVSEHTIHLMPTVEIKLAGGRVTHIRAPHVRGGARPGRHLRSNRDEPVQEDLSRRWVDDTPMLLMSATQASSPGSSIRMLPMTTWRRRIFVSSRKALSCPSPVALSTQFGERGCPGLEATFTFISTPRSALRRGDCHEVKLRGHCHPRRRCIAGSKANHVDLFQRR